MVILQHKIDFDAILVAIVREPKRPVEPASLLAQLAQYRSFEERTELSSIGTDGRSRYTTYRCREPAVDEVQFRRFHQSMQARTRPCRQTLDNEQLLEQAQISLRGLAIDTDPRTEVGQVEQLPIEERERLEELWQLCASPDDGDVRQVALRDRPGVGPKPVATSAITRPRDGLRVATGEHDVHEPRTDQRIGVCAGVSTECARECSTK